MEHQINLDEWMKWLNDRKVSDKIEENLQENSKDLFQESKEIEKLQDFGEKIGGARKDIWRTRGLNLKDAALMNSAERDRYIKKDNVWKKPDYENLVKEGLPVRVAYFIKQMRDAAPVSPLYNTNAVKDEEDRKRKQNEYIMFLTELKEAVMNVKTEEEVKTFYTDFFLGREYVIRKNSWYVDLTEKSHGYINNKLLKASQVSSFYRYDREIQKKQFCYSEEEKLMDGIDIKQYNTSSWKFEQDYSKRTLLKHSLYGGTEFFYPRGEMGIPKSWRDNTYVIIFKHSIVAYNIPTHEEAKKVAYDYAEKIQKSNKETGKETKRKGRFVPKQLAHIKRIGEDIRNGRDMTGEDFIKDFSIKGGEFGNWMNDNDRKESVNLCYEAFHDLAKCLDMEEKDISLNGRLSIAFGARGHGSAAAHYEPDREVINITKMKGAGSLGHEWCHALDDIMRKQQGYAGISVDAREVAYMKEVMNKIKYIPKRPNECMTDDKKYNADIKGIEKKSDQEELAIIDYRGKEFYPIDADIAYGLFRIYKEEIELCQINENTKELISSKEELLKAIKKGVMLGVEKEKWDAMAMKYSSLRNETDFYKNAKEFDMQYSKQDKGYWQSDVELFARAGACFILDKLKEKAIQNDYLCGHAESAISISLKTGDVIKGYPDGNERKQINQAFDKLITDLKEKGLLKARINPSLGLDVVKANNVKTGKKEKIQKKEEQER